MELASNSAESPKLQVEDAAQYIGDRITPGAQIGIIAGTGLGVIADVIQTSVELPYHSIPNFPKSEVTSHEGVLVAGTLNGVDVICLKGRAHLYEGHSPNDVVLPVRTLALLGIKTLIITNAAGGINRDFRRGDVMSIDDQINLQFVNPLVGRNIDEWGPRFPDMSDLYARDLREVAQAVASSAGVQLHSGVYASILGPNLETKAEYTMLGRIGVDAIGMSTTLEAIAAHHMGVRVAGFSIITDECFPETLVPVVIADVLQAAATGGPKLSAIVEGMVKQLGKQETVTH
ncbi:MAG: purine-nucleoside phosphorylase [Rhodothermales bacterium]|nr:purine-nucleoside phosphorylase [Rhodothermales bacterium]